MQTLSFHLGGGKANQGHNRRAARSTGRNVDRSRSDQNIILVDQNERKAYKRIFGQAMQDFNERQTHKDRIIKSYYDQIAKDSKKHTSYELIVQIGGKKDPTPQNGDEISVYIDYVNNFKKRNPNLIVIGAYIHCDETHSHLHLDYIPIKHSKRGMAIQNSQEGALNEMGFYTKSKSDTAQMAWEQSERDYLRELCHSYNIALFDQGIGRKRHLEVQEYKDVQDQIEALKGQIRALQGVYDKGVSKYNDLLDKIDEKISQYDELQGYYDQAKNDFEQLKDELQSIYYKIDKIYDFLDEHEQQEIEQQYYDLEDDILR